MVEGSHDHLNIGTNSSFANILKGGKSRSSHLRTRDVLRKSKEVQQVRHQAGKNTLSDPEHDL